MRGVYKTTTNLDQFKRLMTQTGGVRNAHVTYVNIFLNSTDVLDCTKLHY